MRPLAWYLANLLSLAAIAAFCVAMVSVAQALNPQAFPDGRPGMADGHG